MKEAPAGWRGYGWWRGYLLGERVPGFGADDAVDLRGAEVLLYLKVVDLFRGQLPVLAVDLQLRARAVAVEMLLRPCDVAAVHRRRLDLEVPARPYLRLRCRRLRRRCAVAGELRDRKRCHRC